MTTEMMSMVDVFNTSTTTTGGHPMMDIQLARALGFRYVGITVGIIAIIIGSLGNFLTIVAYYTTKKLRTTFHLFILQLSIVDFFTATFMLPFNVAGYVMGEWPFGTDNVTARLQQFSYFNCGYTSVAFLMGITVNRFIGVILPHSYNTLFRGKNLTIILLICWFTAPVFLLPFLVGYDSECKDGLMTGFHPQQLVCTFICLKSYRPYMEFTRVFFQLVPFAFMIAVYGFIFLNRMKSLKKNRRISGTRTEVHVDSVTQENTSMRPSQQLESTQSHRNQKANKRLLKVSMVICTGFAITFLPSVFINLVPNSTKIDVRYHMLCSNFTWLNSIINPIAYAILNPNFRAAYKRIIIKIIRRLEQPVTETRQSINPDCSNTNRRC